MTRKFFLTGLVAFAFQPSIAPSFSPAQTRVGYFSYSAAKTNLLHSLRHTYPCPMAHQQALGRVLVTPDDLQITGEIWVKGKVRSGDYAFRFSDVRHIREFQYSHGQEPEKWCGNDAQYGATFDIDRLYLFIWNKKEDADSFVSTLTWLTANAEHLPIIAARELSEFNQRIAEWRAASGKAPMPAEAHVHQVLAENAVREKDLDKAIDEYEAALEIFPTWPDGQSNVALICGETGDYDCAIEHMQEYLALVPDAPDAQAAKDKLIIWKDKLSQSQAQAVPPDIEAKSRKRR